MPNKLNCLSLSWVIISDIGCIHKKLGSKLCLQWNVRDITAAVLKYSMLHCSLGPVKEPVLVSFMIGVANNVQKFSHKVLYNFNISDY
jgi:hypothetical protein